MITLIEKDDTPAIEAYAVVVDRKGNSYNVLVAITPYLCSKCDNTHLSIDMGALNIVMLIDLEPSKAEALAAKLNTPFIIDGM